MLNWRVIYPRGDRTRLDIAQVRDYEQSDWDLASREVFPNTDEGKAQCHALMLTLAAKHGLSAPRQQAFLD